MTQSDSNATIRASGIAREDLAALLADAEPRRMTNLAASLNLSVALFLTLLGSSPLQGSFLWPVVAAIAAGLAWTVSNRLWRDIALASVAQTLGEPWGQSRFASGWGAVDFEKWIANLFNEEGRRITAWQAEGAYRDIAYRLTESTVWRRRRSQQYSEITHLMQIEIAVPQSFAGRVEILPKAGIMTAVDDLVRQVSGNDVRRQEIDPDFDAVFDTMASSNADVRAVLTPGFQRAMLKLAARNPQSYLSARFEHGWFNLRLPLPHVVFANAGLLRPMDRLLDDVETLWWDLTIAHRLIDSLMGDHDGPLR